MKDEIKEIYNYLLINKRDVFALTIPMKIHLAEIIIKKFTEAKDCYATIYKYAVKKQ